MQLLLPPLDLTDTSILLAVGAIILLITAQLSPSHDELSESTIDKKKLDTAAIITGAAFLATIIIRVINIILEA